jgi:hypothetical protein
MRTVGTCGDCGGAVQVPSDWLGMNPPTPTCALCGATPKEAFGPTLEMKPRSNKIANGLNDVIDFMKGDNTKGKLTRFQVRPANHKEYL